MSISVQASALPESASDSLTIQPPGSQPQGSRPPSVQQLARAPVTMQTGRSIGRYWQKVALIVAKDLRIEMRAKEIIVVMAAFSALAVIIFGIAFDLRVPRPTMVAPGVLWGVLLFSGILGLNRSFSAEADHQTLTALLLAPIDRMSTCFNFGFSWRCCWGLSAMSGWVHSLRR
jgi:hypothetical protein